MTENIIKNRVIAMRNKRFIAGAVCPQCKLADKIFTYLNDKDDQWRACASCDFEESLAEAFVSQQEEIPTRVNQNRIGEQPLAHEVAVEAVKFIDPK
ncbi:YheV family putative metal-binding protein [Pseudomonadales bacterium]|nr:YheV family putative metal-binding protein [Pseudomonadales bacterium]